MFALLDRMHGTAWRIFGLYDTYAEAAAAKVDAAKLCTDIPRKIISISHGVIDEND